MRKNNKKTTLCIPEYIEHLHLEHPYKEVHHWMPKSKIQCNDFFVCCIPHELHYEIHSKRSVQWYIEREGRENLLLDSAIMFARWILTTSAREHPNYKRFVEMILEINKQPDVYEHVLEATRKCAFDISTNKEGQDEL